MSIYIGYNVSINLSTNSKKIKAGDKLYVSSKTGKVVKHKRKDFNFIGIALSAPDINKYVEIQVTLK
jgi:hypothetical protein